MSTAASPQKHMPKFKQWLNDAGLGHLHETLSEAGVDMDVIGDLTDADFKELDINLGDRRRLLKLIGQQLQVRDSKVGSSGEADLRQVTIMFCDLADFTRLTNKVDPEVLRGYLRYYQSTCSRAVERYGGYLSRFVGDGVLSVFGYPHAHENDAERAVRAALDIVDDITSGVDAPGLSVIHAQAVRIGIATGLVLAGDLIGKGDSEQTTFLGATTALAARLQALAEPNSVVVSNTTRQILGSKVDYDDVGPAKIKGVDDPVSVWRVLGIRGAKSRFVDTYRNSDSVLVGRDREMAILNSHWLQVYAGTGSVVRIEGEAGIGKSRLCADFLSRYGERMGCYEVFMQCSSFHSTSAFFPVIDEIRTSAGITSDDNRASRIEKLEQLVTQWGLEDRDAFKHIANIVFSAPAFEIDPKLSPERLRQLTISLLVQRITRLAQQRPVIVLVEDVQWIDPSTNDYLAELTEATVNEKILVLMTTREAQESGFPEALLSEEIVLNGLGEEDVKALVRLTAARKQPAEVLDANIIDTITARADGVPLFVEELTKSVVEAIDALGKTPTKGLGHIDIPRSLRDPLAARLDRLGDAKSVAQLGAIFGRPFTLEMLQALWAGTPASLLHAIDSLVDAELLDRQGNAGEYISYTFHHALVRDAAYASLLNSKRKALHHAVAKLFAANAERGDDVRAEAIAKHYQSADDFESAANWWLAACRDALRRQEIHEAKAHVELGLENVVQLPPERNRQLLEREMQIVRGEVLIAVEGHAAEEAGAAFARAIDLTKRLDDGAYEFDTLWGVTAGTFVRAEIDRHTELSCKLYEMAQISKDRVQLMVANCSRALNRFAAGNFDECQRFMAETLSLYQPAKDAGLVDNYAVDRKVLALQFGSQASWMLGYTNAAVALVTEMQRHAESLGHPYSLAQSLTSGANVYMLRNEHVKLREMAEKGIEIAAAHDQLVWVDHGEVWIGWALAQEGDLARGIRLIERAIDRYRKSGAKLSLAKFYALIADILILDGQYAAADQYLEFASEHIEHTGERSHLADVTRIKGWLRHKSEPNGAHAVDALFASALGVAGEQNARSLELKIALTWFKMCDERQRDCSAALRLLHTALEKMPEVDQTADRVLAVEILKKYAP